MYSSMHMHMCVHMHVCYVAYKILLNKIRFIKEWEIQPLKGPNVINNRTSYTFIYFHVYKTL
jgi:hypothetical protein